MSQGDRGGPDRLPGGRQPIDLCDVVVGRTRAVRPASKTVVFCSVSDHQPLEDSHVRGGHQDLSHLPPKGAQSP